MRAAFAQSAASARVQAGRAAFCRRHVATLPKKVQPCQASAAGAGSDPYSVCISQLCVGVINILSFWCWLRVAAVHIHGLRYASNREPCNIPCNVGARHSTGRRQQAHRKSLSHEEAGSGDCRRPREHEEAGGSPQCSFHGSAEHTPRGASYIAGQSAVIEYILSCMAHVP